MKKAMLLAMMVCLALNASAGFRAKKIKPKRPEQYQVHVTSGAVTFAADLLLDDGDQKDFFYKALTPSKIIAVRLAVLNRGASEVTVPVRALRLVGPDGKELPHMEPEAVARAVLDGTNVASNQKPNNSGPQVGPNIHASDPRTDPTYDPRTDPNDPTYDPSDPRNRTSGNGPYGNGPYGGPMGMPGVNVVLGPAGGTTGDLTQFERQLAAKDFDDKAFTSEPILPSQTRDKFVYFYFAGTPEARISGYTLLLPAAKGVPQEIVLKF